MWQYEISHQAGGLFANPSVRSYEPELFPGFIYRIITRTLLLIFVSEKLVSEAKERFESYEAFETSILNKETMSISFNMLQYTGLRKCISPGRG